MADGQIVIDITGDASEYERALDRLQGETRKSASGMSSALKGVGSAVAGMAAAVGFGQLVSEAAAATDATQKFKKTLDFAGLGSDEIDALAKSTKAYADQTVYELSDIQNVTAQLAANSVPNYDKLAEAAGNLNAVAGGNVDTFKSVGMVLTQTAGMGKLTTENWNQLSEAIPGASGMLQEAMKKNGAYTGNFREAMERGEITAEEFNQAIMDLGMTDAAREAATATDTFEGSFGNLKATVVGGLGEILGVLQPAITGAANLLSGVLGPALSQVAEWVGGAVDRLSSLADAVGDAGSLSEGISTVFSGLSGIVADALTGLVGFVAEHMATMATTIATLLPTVVPAVMEGITTLVSTVAGLLPTLLPQLIGGVTALVQALAATLPQVLPAITDGIVSLITSVAGMLPTLIPVLVTGAVSLFMALVQALPQVIPPLVAAIPTVIQAAVDVLPTLIPALMDGAVQLFTAIVEAIPQILPPLLSAIGSLIQSGIQHLPSFVGSMGSAALTLFRAISNAVPRVLGALRSAIGSLIQSGVSAVGSYVGEMASAGLNLVQGIVNGIGSGAGWVASKIQEVCSNAVGALKSFFGIASPSKLMAEMGGYIMQGLANGIGDDAKLAVRAMDGAMSDVSVAAAKGVPDIDIPFDVPMPAGGRGALGFSGSLASARDSMRGGSYQGFDASRIESKLDELGRKIDGGFEKAAEAMREPVSMTWNKRELGRLNREAAKA